jgi:uncharacterized protein YbjQ (UPF0145 family)
MISEEMMLITTQHEFPDHNIVKIIGLVKGNSTRAKHIGIDVLVGLRNIVGGELFEYTKLYAETREQALDRMISASKCKDADGIIGVRFSTSMIRKGLTEIIAYGTAVKLMKK